MKILYVWLTSLLLASLPFLSAKAQETYFNVPESDITEKHKIIAQQQFTVQDFYRSSTTVNYGLGRDWEIGVNLYNLDYEPNSHKLTHNDSTTQIAYAPLLLFNVQKGFDLTKELKVGFGTQAGINLSPSRQSKFVHYTYVNLAGTFADDHYRATVGAFTGNSRFLGEGAKVGFQAGFDAGLFYQKLHLLGDWISGTHDLGQLVLGVEVYLNKHLPLAIGWQRANQDGSQALVVQLSYAPQ